MFAPTQRARWIASASATLTAILLATVLAPTAVAATAAPSRLGSAAAYSVLAGTAATVPGSVLPGEVGAIGAITGDAGSQYGSALHTSDDIATRLAVADAAAGHTALNLLPATAELVGTDLGGQTLLPGVYRSAAAYSVTGPLTFDAQGDSEALFVLQTDAALNTTAGTTMTLINGAQAANIVWVTGGAATLGASTVFTGTILSAAAITVGATSRIDGRALSTTAAVTLDGTTFSAIPVPTVLAPEVIVPVFVAPVDVTPVVTPTEVVPVVIDPVSPVVVAPVTPVTVTPAPVVVSPAVAPAIVITGGSGVVYTRSVKPTISGTTLAPAGSTVTVTISGTKHTAPVSAGGSWAVTSSTVRRDGTLAIVATVSMPTGLATAKQTLILDTVAPRVLVTGGATLFSAITSPTLSGTASEVALGSTVSVTVAGRSFAATVGPQGLWSVPVDTALPEGLSTIVAKAVDRAGNVGTGIQARTVDTIAPAISVTGGTTALTRVAKATFSGTTDAPAGSVVTVAVAGQTKTAKVTTAQTWKVALSTAVANGTSTANITVLDKAANAGTTTQTLTVDTVAPTLTLAGGAAATTLRTTPQITGTTDAPAGTRITVKVGSRTLATVAGTDGTWSAASTYALAEGVVAVAATTTDAAGNGRTVTQALTVDAYVDRSSTTTVYFSAGSAALSADAAAAVRALTLPIPANAMRVKISVVGNQSTGEAPSTTLAAARAKTALTAARAGLTGTYLLSGGNAGVLGEAAQYAIVTVRYEVPAT